MRIINADDILDILLQLNPEDTIKVKDIISIINIRDTIIDVQNVFDDINVEIKLAEEYSEYIKGLEYAKRVICNNTNRTIYSQCSWCNNPDVISNKHRL